MELSGQFHALDALPQRQDPQYPMDRRLNGPQNWSGHCDEGGGGRGRFRGYL